MAENGGMSHAAKIYGKVISSMKCVEFGWDTSQPLHYMSAAPCIFVIILMNNGSSCFQMGEASGRSWGMSLSAGNELGIQPFVTGWGSAVAHRPNKVSW